MAVATAAPAQADHHLGHRSLADVLAADGKRFDTDRQDFDIVDNAVRAALSAKPKSDVAVLADGSVPLTAFVPNDGAFRRLVKDLTGTRYAKESRVFNELAKAVGIDTVEQVLLYHVVPGQRISYATAKKADGATLDTALGGGTLTVDVRTGKRVFLEDADPDDADARVVRKTKNLNQGNQQLAHGISQVLRPADL